MNAIHATNAAGGTDATRRTVLAAAVVIVGLAGLAARADVRVFVTSSADGYGLDLLGPQGDGTGTDPAHEDWPIDPFRPTYSTVDIEGNHYAYDYEFGYYRAAAYPPIDAPSGTPADPIQIDVSAGEIGYMWFQFRGEPANIQVNGFISSVRLPQGDPAQDLTLTYYVQNDIWGESYKKRFDGLAFPPEYENWHANPFLTDQLTSHSIINGTDDASMMFDNQVWGASRWGVALLGALSGPPDNTLYEFKIDYIDYTQSPNPPTVGESCYFRLVPEPGSVSMLLAVLVGCSRTRRICIPR